MDGSDGPAGSVILRLDTVRVELRPRSPWEAVELGMALVRHHAASIWRPWLAITLPVFVACNALAWSLDRMWLAALAMWWLLPLFDRIPLFVLSRSVFGATPSTRPTLSAQRTWGWRAMAGMLGWRRLSPWRAATLPVDLLEGQQGVALRERRRVVGDGIVGLAVLVTVACHLFIVALTLSSLALVLMFVPEQLLSESMRAMWALLIEQPPRGVQLALNGVLWMAMSAVEPFFVGAGFGLYLNRRVQIEAWDIEIALRRMRARVAASATALLAAIALGLLAPVPAQAQQRIDTDRERAAQAQPVVEKEKRSTRPTLPEVFGEDAVVDDASFRQAVARALEDPLLDRKRTDRVWELRNPSEPDAVDEMPEFLRGLARLFAILGEYGLWLLFGIALLTLLLTARHWWPWMRGVARTPTIDSEVTQIAVALPDALPDDLAGAVTALWREGWHRRALALLYRGSVQAMAARAGAVLVPGATEAECLRASRRLADPDERAAFAGMVRTWQYAAYADRLPDDGEFAALVAELSQRFGWAR